MSTLTSSFVVTGDTISPALRALAARARNPAGLLRAAANGVKRDFQDHFRLRHGQPNKRGWPKAGLWLQFSRSTAVTKVDNSTAVVTVAHPAIMQRLRGGTIVPKRGKYLAIPAIAAAYAAGSPREGGAPNLVVGRFPDPERPSWGPRLGLAVDRSVFKETGRKRKDGTRKSVLVSERNTVWYWLVRKVTQRGDPKTVPEARILQATVDRVIAQALARQGVRV
jgi:hypothetical protein